MPVIAKDPVIQEWDNKAREVLKGRTIIEARYLKMMVLPASYQWTTKGMMVVHCSMVPAVYYLRYDE